MAFEQHERTKSGRFRRERADALAKNLRLEYPEFDKVHGSTKLGTLEKLFGVNSLTAVRNALRAEDAE
jgi:hypothetical protein